MLVRVDVAVLVGLHKALVSCYPDGRIETLGHPGSFLGMAETAEVVVVKVPAPGRG
jgi:hypothetical protein